MDGIKALAFDVFGTVVDWRSTIIRECAELGKLKNLDVDWPAFADAWRAGYAPAMEVVNRGELPWTPLDRLNRMILDRLSPRFQLEGLSEAEKDHLNRVWHRLNPWPDAVGGLSRLRRRFVLATLSNGNMALLVNMAKHASLPWDCVLSAELARQYKPARAVYQMAVDLLDLRPEQVMMVAAHKSDLHAAKQAGLRTAFVPRPLEFGSAGAADNAPDASFDVTARDLFDLADKLGA